MLSKQFRLPASQKFFQALFFKENEFVVKAQKNTYPYNRYGFVLSKTIDKRATQRNRFKRMVRSCVEQLHINNGFDVLFIMRPPIKNATREELLQKIKVILEKLS